MNDWLRALWRKFWKPTFRREMKTPCPVQKCPGTMRVKFSGNPTDLWEVCDYCGEMRHLEAVLFNVDCDDDNDQAWVPRSLLTSYDDEEMWIPEWKAEEIGADYE
jgi:hypothetical protein